MQSLSQRLRFSCPNISLGRDLHATITGAMGISANLSYEVEKRPFYVTNDGKGKPVMPLFA